MSLLLLIAFLLILGYIESMSIPSIQQQLQQQEEQQFEPANIIKDDISDIFFDRLTNDLKINNNNKKLFEKILQNSHHNTIWNNGNDGNIDGDFMTSDQGIKKRSENNNFKSSEELIDYQKTLDDCSKKCFADFKLFDDEYENLMQKYKFMQNILATLGQNYFEDLNNPNLNSSGRREGPLYAEEPKYIVVPKEVEDDLLDFSFKTDSVGFKDFFIPPRGRKQMPLLEKIKNRYELFVPNRGKKATNTSKKDKIKDIFKYNDLFFPNRGKKNAGINKNIESSKMKQNF